MFHNFLVIFKHFKLEIGDSKSKFVRIVGHPQGKLWPICGVSNPFFGRSAIKSAAPLQPRSFPFNHMGHVCGVVGNILHSYVLSFCVLAIKSRLTGIFSPIKRACPYPHLRLTWSQQRVCEQRKHTFVKRYELEYFGCHQMMPDVRNKTEICSHQRNTPKYIYFLQQEMRGGFRVGTGLVFWQIGGRAIFLVQYLFSLCVQTWTTALDYAIAQQSLTCCYLHPPSLIALCALALHRTKGHSLLLAAQISPLHTSNFPMTCEQA